MNLILPQNAGLDLASTSASFINDISPILYIIMGVIFAFFIIDSLVLILIDVKEKNKK